MGAPLAIAVTRAMDSLMDDDRARAVDATIEALLGARRSGKAVATPATALPDAGAAYAVQDAVADALGWWGGATPRFWKSGGPGRDAPQTHAALPPDGVWHSPAASASWPFHFRGIEAEIALRLRRDVDAALAATLDRDAASALVDAMCVSIEIVDSRWIAGLGAPAWARLADLQSHGALVLGAWTPFAERDWSRQGCTVTIGGREPMRFIGTHAFGDPSYVLPRWLRHATRRGATVAAGSVVTTGTWCGLPIAEAGDAVTVAFDAIGSATVRL